MSTQRPRVIAISGNIGSGKNELLDELEKRGYTVLRKNDKLLDELLIDYCDDNTSYGFQLEVLLFKLTLNLYREIESLGGNAIKDIVFICGTDRDRRMITELRSCNGSITLVEYELLNRLNEIIPEWAIECDDIVMLDVPAEECCENVCNNTTKKNLINDIDIYRRYLKYDESRTINLEWSYDTIEMKCDYLVDKLGIK